MWVTSDLPKCTRHAATAPSGISPGISRFAAISLLPKSNRPRISGFPLLRNGIIGRSLPNERG